MKISKEGSYSVETLKEKFACAGRGKENFATAGIVPKQHVVDEPTQKDTKQAKVEKDEEEPLLVENKKRFVLFPIKYHEANPPICTYDWYIDLANV